MPIACSFVWVSSERLVQAVESSSVASCWTLVRFNGFSLLKPGGGSGQVRYVMAWFVGLP